MILWNERNHKKVRKAIKEVYKSIGTIHFDTWEELGWMLGLPYGPYIKVAVNKLEHDRDIWVLYTDKGIAIDVLPF